MPATRLVIKITHGPEGEDLERLAQGLTVATAALAAGLEVSVWLTGEATRVARPGERLPALEHSAPLEDLVSAVVDLGTLTVCTQCAARRGLTLEDLHEGTRIAGAAAFVEETIADGTRALVY